MRRNDKAFHIFPIDGNRLSVSAGCAPILVIIGRVIPDFIFVAGVLVPVLGREG